MLNVLRQVATEEVSAKVDPDIPSSVSLRATRPMWMVLVSTGGREQPIPMAEQ